MIAAALLVAALAIVGYGIITGRSFAARVAALAGRTSRPRMIFAWAAGSWAVYGLSTLVALIALGRIEAVTDLPIELAGAAWALGLPGWVDTTTLAILGGEMVLGALIGIAILWWRGRRGMPSFGIAYRSPAAMRGAAEWPAALALSLAAGIGEELFFRLLLPLLVAIVFGSGIAGVAFGFVAFITLHRHQGVPGMIAVALVGAVLTTLYLATGRLWLAMIVHVAIDLNALILRPLFVKP